MNCRWVPGTRLQPIREQKFSSQETPRPRKRPSPFYSFTGQPGIPAAHPPAKPGRIRSARTPAVDPEKPLKDASTRKAERSPWPRQAVDACRIPQRSRTGLGTESCFLPWKTGRCCCGTGPTASGWLKAASRRRQGQPVLLEHRQQLAASTHRLQRALQRLAQLLVVGPDGQPHGPSIGNAGKGQ